VRTWSTVAKVPTAWRILAAPVSNNPTTQPPFVAYPADADFTLPRLALDLVISRPDSTSMESQGAYTLRNSSGASGRGVNLVCTEVARS
jgi:hypothetical protein